MTGRHALNRSTRLTGQVGGVRVSAVISGWPDAAEAVRSALEPLIIRHTVNRRTFPAKTARRIQIRDRGAGC
jgi:molybdopterin biosynthesis enzyme MoaB